MPSTQADVAAENRGKSWGATEALLAWPAAVFIGTGAYLLVLQLGGYSASIPQRPGGHLGRAAVLNLAGQVVREKPASTAACSGSSGLWHGATVNFVKSSHSRVARYSDCNCNFSN